MLLAIPDIFKAMHDVFVAFLVGQRKWFGEIWWLAGHFGASVGSMSWHGRVDLRTGCWPMLPPGLDNTIDLVFAFWATD